MQSSWPTAQRSSSIHITIGNGSDSFKKSLIQNRDSIRSKISHRVAGREEHPNEAGSKQHDIEPELLESILVSEDLGLSNHRSETDWEQNKLKDLNDQLESLNQDLCDVLCIGCYHIISSILDEPNNKLLLARHLKIHRPFAIAVREKDQYHSSWDKEVKLLRLIQDKNTSPFILRLKDSFQTHGHILTVFEYMECGSLEQRMLKGAFNEQQALYYASCMLLAISHLHKLNIAHQGLSLKCSYLSSLGLVKVSDLRNAYKEDRLFLNEEFLRKKYRDVNSWAVCLQNMLSGKIKEEPDYDVVLTFDNQEIQDLMIKIFDRMKTLEKCQFVSKLPPSEVSSMARITKHPLFKHVDWQNFRKGLAISPDFHQLVVEEKVCPMEQWKRLLDAEVNPIELNEKLYPKKELWIKSGNTKLKVL